MPYSIPTAPIRKIDLATFTGDAWAEATTLDVPLAADVPRLIASPSGVVRWVARGMSSDLPDATAVIDATTTFGTAIVKINALPGGVEVASAIAANSGALAGIEQTETDVSPGDVIVIAVTNPVAGAAPWLWVYPTSGCTPVQ